MGIDVSVITTLYNYKDYVCECIDSFKKQTLDNIEMIIIDDASTDKPWDKIKDKMSSNISYIRLDKNSGYSHAKNVGIRAAKSDVLVMLDADDMLTKNSLEIRLAKINSGYDFVHGPVLDYKKGKINRSKLWKQWKKSKKDASCYRLVHAQSVMLRRDIHKTIGLYDEKLRSKSDREMWARVFNHGFKVGYVDKDVSYYRRHSKQMHRSPEKLKINEQLQKAVLKTIKRRSKDLSDVVLLVD